MKHYQAPSLTIKKYDCCDIITASTGKESISFDLDWVSGVTGGDGQ